MPPPNRYTHHYDSPIGGISAQRATVAPTHHAKGSGYAVGSSRGRGRWGSSEGLRAGAVSPRRFHSPTAAADGRGVLGADGAYMHAHHERGYAPGPSRNGNDNNNSSTNTFSFATRAARGDFAGGSGAGAPAATRDASYAHAYALSSNSHRHRPQQPVRATVGGDRRHRLAVIAGGQSRIACEMQQRLRGGGGGDGGLSFDVHGAGYSAFGCAAYECEGEEEDGEALDAERGAVGGAFHQGPMSAERSSAHHRTNPLTSSTDPRAAPAVRGPAQPSPVAFPTTSSAMALIPTDEEDRALLAIRPPQHDASLADIARARRDAATAAAEASAGRGGEIGRWRADDSHGRSLSALAEGYGEDYEDKEMAYVTPAPLRGIEDPLPATNTAYRVSAYEEEGAHHAAAAWGAAHSDTSGHGVGAAEYAGCPTGEGGSFGFVGRLPPFAAPLAPRAAPLPFDASSVFGSPLPSPLRVASPSAAHANAYAYALSEQSRYASAAGFYGSNHISGESNCVANRLAEKEAEAAAERADAARIAAANSHIVNSYGTNGGDGYTEGLLRNVAYEHAIKGAAYAHDDGIANNDEGSLGGEGDADEEDEEEDVIVEHVHIHHIHHVTSGDVDGDADERRDGDGEEMRDIGDGKQKGLAVAYTEAHRIPSAASHPKPPHHSFYSGGRRGDVEQLAGGGPSLRSQSSPRGPRGGEALQPSSVVQNSGSPPKRIAVTNAPPTNAKGVINDGAQHASPPLVLVEYAYDPNFMPVVVIPTHHAVAAAEMVADPRSSPRAGKGGRSDTKAPSDDALMPQYQQRASSSPQTNAHHHPQPPLRSGDADNGLYTMDAYASHAHQTNVSALAVDGGRQQMHSQGKVEYPPHGGRRVDDSSGAVRTPPRIHEGGVRIIPERGEIAAASSSNGGLGGVVGEGIRDGSYATRNGGAADEPAVAGEDAALARTRVFSSTPSGHSSAFDVAIPNPPSVPILPAALNASTPRTEVGGHNSGGALALPPSQQGLQQESNQQPSREVLLGLIESLIAQSATYRRYMGERGEGAGRSASAASSREREGDRGGGRGASSKGLTRGGYGEEEGAPFGRPLVSRSASEADCSAISAIPRHAQYPSGDEAFGGGEGERGRGEGRGKEKRDAKETRPPLMLGGSSSAAFGSGSSLLSGNTSAKGRRRLMSPSLHGLLMGGGGGDGPLTTPQGEEGGEAAVGGAPHVRSVSSSAPHSRSASTASRHWHDPPLLRYVTMADPIYESIVEAPSAGGQSRDGSRSASVSVAYASAASAATARNGSASNLLAPAAAQSIVQQHHQHRLSAAVSPAISPVATPRRAARPRSANVSVSFSAIGDDPRYTPEQERTVSRRRELAGDAVTRIIDLIEGADEGGSADVGDGVGTNVWFATPAVSAPSSTAFVLPAGAGGQRHPSASPKSLYRRRFAVRI